MIEQACNGYVLVLRDKTEMEIGGLQIPSGGRVKPHTGTIHAVGNLVKDELIKESKGKKCLWHPSVGWEITYEDIIYLVLKDDEIIAVP